jgi:hypothetical protein
VLAALVVSRSGGGVPVLAAAALAFVVAAAWVAAGSRGASSASRVRPPDRCARWRSRSSAGSTGCSPGRCSRCASAQRACRSSLSLADTFGQLIGLASLIPGGVGSSDAFWIARLPSDRNVTAAALTAYRFVYYIGPWFTASLLLLSWMSKRSKKRTALARRVIGALVGGAGILMALSALPRFRRPVLSRRLTPLPLVEAGTSPPPLPGFCCSRWRAGWPAATAPRSRRR